MDPIVVRTLNDNILLSFIGWLALQMVVKSLELGFLDKCTLAVLFNALQYQEHFPICKEILESMKMPGGSIAQWIAYLLHDPAAPGFDSQLPGLNHSSQV